MTISTSWSMIHKSSAQILSIKVTGKAVGEIGGFTTTLLTCSFSAAGLASGLHRMIRHNLTLPTAG